MGLISTQPRTGDIVFECTRLKSVELLGKKGVITPDRDGCYTQVIGALGAFNSAGDFYDLEAGRKFFLSQSAFQRKIARGSLKAELGHPVREPGMTDEQFAERILKIDDDRVCGTWRKIWLSQEKIKDDKGRYVVPILGKIYPIGLKGNALREAFEAKGENVFFSIRSFTRDIPTKMGYFVKMLEYIVTFDQVGEPGISVAEKLLSPGLESYGSYRLDIETLIKAVDRSRKNNTGIESAGLYDFKERLVEIKNSRNISGNRANFTQW